MNEHVERLWVDTEERDEAKHIVNVLMDAGLIDKKYCNQPNTSYLIRLSIDLVDDKK